jgi:hypothetical protein
MAPDAARWRVTPAAMVGVTVWLVAMTVATLHLPPLDRTPLEICHTGAVGPGAVNRMTLTLWPPGATRCVQSLPGTSLTDTLYVPVLEWLVASLFALGVFAVISALRETPGSGARLYAGLCLLLGSLLAWNIGAILALILLAVGLAPYVAYLSRTSSFDAARPSEPMRED